MSDEKIEEIAESIWFSRNQLSCLVDKLAATPRQHDEIKIILSRLWDDYEKLKKLNVTTKQT